MARVLCAACQRPQVACICSFVTAINNQVLVVILQHPKEVGQTKGTADLLARSLKRCEVIVGEDFTDNEALNRIISEYQALLLYPSEQAKVINHTLYQQASTKKPLCIILLDGTWKKAYLMFMLSKNLQKLTQVCLPESIEGQYQIRKTKKENALSTLEACCYALVSLEEETSKLPVPYQHLLNGFVKFNQLFLSFVPKNKR